MPTLAHDNTVIAYTDTGAPGGRIDSPTIVFGHGLLFGGWMFDKQIAELSRDFRCVAIDWRGQGSSHAPACGYDMDTLTSDMLALIDALAVGPVHYVGLSMGGFVGMRLAARHPDKIRSLVLLSTSADVDDQAGRVASAELAGRLWAFGTHDIRAALEPGSFGPKFREEPENKHVVDDWIQRIDGSDPRGLASAIIGVVTREPIADELAQITANTLVLHGADDGMPASCGTTIAGKIPNARFELLPDCGHACTIEYPGEVTEHIADFLATASEPSDPL